MGHLVPDRMFWAQSDDDTPDDPQTDIEAEIGENSSAPIPLNAPL